MSAPSESIKVSRNFWKIYSLKFLGEFFLLAGLPLLAAMLRHWQEGQGMVE